MVLIFEGSYYLLRVSFFKLQMKSVMSHFLHITASGHVGLTSYRDCTDFEHRN